MKSSSTVAKAPGALPLLGHTLPLLRDPLRFLTSLPANGDLVEIQLGTYRVVVVCDPQLLDQLLRNDRIFDKGGALYERASELGGDGLGTCPHSRHRRQRRLVQPAFHAQRFPEYAQVMTAQLAAMTNSWREGQVLDVMNEMQTMTMSVAMETMFSDALSPTALRQAVNDVSTCLSGMYWRMLMPSVVTGLPTSSNRRYHRARHRLRQTVDTIVSSRRGDAADQGDLLSALLSASEPGLPELTDTELSDQAVTFFISGSETAAAALSWALHLLTQHPDIEKRLHQEVSAVLGRGPARFEHVPELLVTRRVVTETLRLYPPAWIFTRVVSADTDLGSHRLPEGTVIACSPYLIHHRSDLFDDPERFDPDRWENPDRPQPDRNAFVPYGAGPRKCIGSQFSFLEIVLALATITNRWRLRPTSNDPVRPTAVATLRPNRLRLQVTAREAKDRGDPAPVSVATAVCPAASSHSRRQVPEGEGRRD